MFKCILCMNDFDESYKTNEHIYPESIGGNIIIKDICKSCNDHLGSYADSPMINNWFIDAKRYLLKLPGKDGSIPNPFNNLRLASDKTHAIQFKIDSEGNKSLYMPTKLDRPTGADGKEYISIRVDAIDEDKLPIILDKIRKRASKDGKEAIIEFGAREDGHIEKPVVIQTTSFDVLDWQRGILKIAYELTYRHLGVKYLSNPIAQNFRELLKLKKVTEEDFNRYPIHGTISFVSKDIQSFPYLSDPDSLYGALLSVDNRLSCFVKIFDVFQGIVLVSESYAGLSGLDGIIIHIDVPNRKNIEMTYYDLLMKNSNIGKPNGN